MSRLLHARFTVPAGPQVRVRLHLPLDVVRDHRQAGRPVPESVEVSALVDTGAECTCVAPHVVDDLGLKPAGALPVNAPDLGGLRGVYTYNVSLTILHPSGRPRRHLVIPELDVTALDLGGPGYDALIGWDVLARCVLTYDGPAGSFTLGY